MKAAARTLAGELEEQDEVAVVSFDADAYLLLPFSRDRVALEKAIEQVSVLRGPTSKKGSNIYEAVYLTAQELFRGRKGRKAIVLLTDGQDSGLGLSWSADSTMPRAGDASGRLTFEDVTRALASAGVEVEAVSTQPRPKAMTEEWLAAHHNEMVVTGTPCVSVTLPWASGTVAAFKRTTLHVPVPSLVITTAQYGVAMEGGGTLNPFGLWTVITAPAVEVAVKSTGQVTWGAAAE